MKITIESTPLVVAVAQPMQAVLCRVWEGETASGVKVHCLVAVVAAHKDADATQLEAELLEFGRPSMEALEAFPQAAFDGDLG